MADNINRRIKIYVNGEEVEGSLKNIKRSMGEVRRALQDMTVGSEEYEAATRRYAQLNGVLREHQNAIRGVTAAQSELTKQGDRAVGLAARMFVVDTVAQYGQQIVAAGKAVADYAIRFEKLQTAYTVANGSAEKANAELERLQQFAKTTPFEFEKLANSILTLKNRGFSPTNAELTRMGDLTSALNKDFDQFAEAILDAGVGQYERLLEFGIRAEKEGDKVKLSFKGITKEVANNEKAIRDAILAYGELDGIRGAMAAQSETFDGMWSTLTDEFGALAVELGQRFMPVMKDGIKFVSAMLGGLNALIDPAKSSADAFAEQRDRVKGLNATLPPLLDRYDELNAKGNLNKKEQKELGDVIQRIGEITPSAITAVDQYGKALSINAAASRQALEAESARLKVLNKVAITQNEMALQGLKNEQERLQLEIQRGTVSGMVAGAGGIEEGDVAITTERIQKNVNRLKELSTEIKGTQAQLDMLAGKAYDEALTQTGAAKKVVEANAEAGESAKKRAEKATKAAEKEAEAYKKRAEDIKQSVEDATRALEVSQMNEEEQAVANATDKYGRLIEQAKGFNAEILQLEALREQEIAVIRKRFADKAAEEAKKQAEDAAEKAAEAAKKAAQDKADELQESYQFLQDKEAARQEMQQRVALMQMSDYEQEQAAIAAHYRQMIEEAEDLGVDTTAIKAKWNEEKAKLTEEHLKNEAEKAAAERDAVLEAYSTLFTSLGDAVTAAADLIGDSAVKNNKLARLAALAQIAFDTAAALSSAVRSSASTAGMVPGPAGVIAAAAQYIALSATIMKNIKRAKDLLSEAPPVEQRADGGYDSHTVRGASDGRRYRAQWIGHAGSGMLHRPSLVLAGERGPEYFVSNRELANPYVAGLVRQIDNIRTARMGRPAAGTMVAQYADGGMAAATAASAQNEQLVGVMAQLVQVLRGGIQATVSDPTLRDMKERTADLESYRGKGFA